MDLHSELREYLAGDLASVEDADDLMLYLMDVEDEDETLQEHDARYHPDGFDPETDTCEFREERDAENRAADPKLNVEQKAIKPYKPRATSTRSLTATAMHARRRRANASPEELALIREKGSLELKKYRLKKEGKSLTEEENKRLLEVRSQLNRNPKGSEWRRKKAEVAKESFAKLPPEEQELRKKLGILRTRRYDNAMYPDRVVEIDREIEEARSQLEKLVIARKKREGKPVNKYPTRVTALSSKRTDECRNHLAYLKMQIKDMLEKSSSDPLFLSSLSAEDKKKVDSLQKDVERYKAKLKACIQKDKDDLNEKERKGIIERRKYSETGYTYTVQWVGGRWKLVDTDAPEEVFKALREKQRERARVNKAKRKAKRKAAKELLESWGEGDEIDMNNPEPTDTTPRIQEDDSPAEDSALKYLRAVAEDERLGGVVTEEMLKTILNDIDRALSEAEPVEDVANEE